MDGDDDGVSPYAPTESQAAGGFLDGVKDAINEAGKDMLKAAEPGTRFILKRIPGGPALVYDVADLTSAPNKIRAAFGMAGGWLGAAVGSTLGQGIGEQVSDEPKAAIDHDVDVARQGLDATKQWMADRWRQIAGSHP